MNEMDLVLLLQVTLCGVELPHEIRYAKSRRQLLVCVRAGQTFAVRRVRCFRYFQVRPRRPLRGDSAFYPLSFLGADRAV